MALVDDRGVRVSLSHACPTALDLLLSHDEPLAIVAGPPAVPGRDVPEGLDARGELPPALTDRVLMDFETVTLWEAHVVGMLAGPGAPAGLADEVVAMLTAQADGLAAWTPGGVPLAEASPRLMLLARVEILAKQTAAATADATPPTPPAT